MTVETVLKKRRLAYQKKQSKYLKYVMNDHFVIVVMFLLGAVAYQYAAFVKTLPVDFIWGKIVAALLLAALVFFGQIATLASQADQIFLVAQEAEWQLIIKGAKKRSLIIPAVVLFLATAALMPLVFTGQKFSAVTVTVLFAIGLVLKWLHLSVAEMACRFHDAAKHSRLKGVLYGAGVITYLVAFFVNSFAGLGVAGLTWLFFKLKLTPLNAERLDWEKMVAMETQRVTKRNRFINLFIDVPVGNEKAKRRRYLDGLVQLLSGKENPTQFLFARRFLRGIGYLGLYGRLTVMGLVVILFSQLPMLNLGVGVLVLYLTGFQILPLFGEVNESVMVRLYPQSQTSRELGFSRFLRQVLIIQGLVFALAAWWGTTALAGVVALAANGLFIVFFTTVYVGNRLYKRNRRKV